MKHLQYHKKQEKSLCSMATFHSQTTRTCLSKLACAALVAGLLGAAVFISGAYPHSDLVKKLLSTEGNHQTNLRTNAPNQNQGSIPNQSTTTTDWETIQANNQALQTQLDQVLAKIEQDVHKNRHLMERISRSPRALQAIQALEAAIAFFGKNKPDPKYEVSEYATGNRRWERSPAQHPVSIQDLLLYDIQDKHNQNQILGDKVAQVV
jgi:hypothetical protein